MTWFGSITIRAASPEAGARKVVVFGAGPIGLLFVAALARDGHRVVLADPYRSRLATGEAMGSAATIEIERGGGQAEQVRASTIGGAGADVAVDCVGVPAVWEDAIDVVGPGGLVNLFVDCASGCRIGLDAHPIHYGEITLKGVYHHRPNTVRRALAHLSEPDFPADHLLSGCRPVEETEAALRSMMAKEALKVVIAP